MEIFCDRVQYSVHSGLLFSVIPSTSTPSHKSKRTAERACQSSRDQIDHAPAPNGDIFHAAAVKERVPVGHARPIGILRGFLRHIGHDRADVCAPFEIDLRIVQKLHVVFEKMYAALKEHHLLFRRKGKLFFVRAGRDAHHRVSLGGTNSSASRTNTVRARSLSPSTTNV